MKTGEQRQPESEDTGAFPFYFASPFSATRPLQHDGSLLAKLTLPGSQAQPPKARKLTELTFMHLHDSVPRREDERARGETYLVEIDGEDASGRCFVTYDRSAATSTRKGERKEKKNGKTGRPPAIRFRRHGAIDPDYRQPVDHMDDCAIRE